MDIIETFDNDTQYAPAVRVKQSNHTYVREDLVDKALVEKDKIVEELKTRISELEDKDWYEKCIHQLEEQNNNLIKERDELAFEKRNTFELIEKVSDKGQLEIRKHLCEEIYNFIMDNWDARMGRGIDCYGNTNGRCDKLKEDLEKIAENGYKKEDKKWFG